MKNVMPYLCGDRGSAKLASFFLVAEREVKMAHKMLVLGLVPELPDYVDGIILAEESSTMLTHLLTFLYCGRYDWDKARIVMVWFGLVACRHLGSLLQPVCNKTSAKIEAG